MANVIAEAAVRIRPDTAGFQSETQSSVIGAVKKIAAAAAVAFAAKKIFDFGEQAVQEAAQTQKSLENVKASYGQMTKSVTAFADTAAAKYGISRQASLEFSSSLAVSARNLGLTRVEAAKETLGYQRLAGSLGSIKGIDPASVFDKLKLAMLGSTRGLKQLGISFSSAQQKQEALRLGIKGSSADWTAAQKAQVIYGLVTSHLGSFMDQAKKHSGDLIDVQHRLTAEWANAKEEVGTALLPILEKLGGFVAKYLPAAFELTGRAIRKVIGFIKDLAEPFAGVAGQVKDFIGGVVGEYQNLSKHGIGSTSALKKTTQDTFQKLGVSFKDQKRVIGDFSRAFGEIGGDVQKAIGPLAAFVTGEFDKVSSGIRRNGAEIKQTILTILDFVTGAWQKAWAVVAAVVEAVWPVVKTTIDAALKVIGDVLLVAMDVITGKWGKAWSDLKQLVVDILQGLGRIVYSILANIGPLILKALGLLAGAAGQVGLAIVKALITEVEKLPGQLLDLYILLGRKELEAIAWVAGKAKDVGVALVKALIDEAKKLPGQVWDLLQLVGRKEDQAIGWVAGKAKDLGSAILHAVVNEVEKLPGQIWDMIKQIPGKFSQVWGAIKNGIGAGWSKIESVLEGWVNKLLTPVNWVLGKLGIDKIGFAPSGSSAPSGSRTVHRAAGGFVPGPNVGRDVVPAMLTPGEIVLNRRQQDMLGGPDYLKRLFGFDGAGRYAYSVGGIASSIFGAAKSAFSVLTDPLGWLKSHIPKLPSAPAAMGKILTGLAGYLKDKVLSWVESHLPFSSGAAGPHGSAATGANQRLGLSMMMAAGWPASQWGSLQALWMRESGWNQFAKNPSSGAYGIPQSLPADKMAAAGADWLTNPATQIRWGLGYIRGRYGSPSGAWAHEGRYGWYGQGGVVPGGLGQPQRAVVHGGEMILTQQDRARFGGLSQLAQSVSRLVAKLDKDERGVRIGEVSLHTEAKTFDALRRDALNRLALGVKR